VVKISGASRADVANAACVGASAMTSNVRGVRIGGATHCCMRVAWAVSAHALCLY